MSTMDRIRLDALVRVKRGELTVIGSAELMDVSLRQARRLWKRFKVDGAAGLLHKLRSRPSNSRLSQDVRDRVVKRHQERYADFGPTLACEKLAEDGLQLSPDTLSALLKERGLCQRRRRRGRHRRRRERRACLGSMVQMDGSHHDWFEGRGPRCVLMVMIDDATNLTYARLYGAETTEGAFDIFGRWLKRQGLPRSVYVDRHTIYRQDGHPELPTQFGRAMKELGVELICANSPQAKGRVERRNALFQDRFVKELRLRKISDMTQANALLESKFLAELNGRYAVEPREGQDLHRALDAGLALDEILCVAEPRVVGQDWCVRWQNRWLQIGSVHGPMHLPGRRVRIKHLADGRLVIEHKGERLSFKEIKAKPTAAKAKKAIVNNRQYKPAASHPWKTEAAVGSRPLLKPAPAAPARALAAEKRKAG